MIVLKAEHNSYLLERVLSQYLEMYYIYKFMQS